MVSRATQGWAGITYNILLCIKKPIENPFKDPVSLFCIIMDFASSKEVSVVLCSQLTSAAALTAL